MTILTPGREKTVEDQILEIYTRYRHRLHPDWSPSAKKAGTWIKVAAIVQDLGADPRLFIEAQFELGYAQRGEPAIFPESLTSQKAIETYREYQTAFRPIPTRKVEQEMRLLAAAITKGGLTQDAAAAHPAVQLSAWFRILACSDAAAKNIRATYLGAALDELRRDPDLANYVKNRFHDRYQSRIWTPVSGPSGHAPSSVPPPSEPSYVRASFGGGI